MNGHPRPSQRRYCNSSVKMFRTSHPHNRSAEHHRHTVVHIQRQHGTTNNMADLPPPIFQMACDITAHVLNGITPCLRHLPVLFHGLRGVLRGAYPLAEILPGYLVVFPPGFLFLISIFPLTLNYSGTIMRLYRSAEKDEKMLGFSAELCII